MQVTSLPGGTAVNAGPRGQWRHPWFVAPRWTGKKWVCTVKPGTVNGQAPAYRTYAQEQEDLGFGFSPLDGHAYFSDPIFTGGSRPDPNTPIDIPIYQSPLIELRLREAGLAGANDQVVPDYFVRLGVEQTITPEEQAAALENGDNPRARTPGARRMQVADIILHQPRAGLTVEITIQPDFNGVSNVTQRLTVQTPDAGDALRVFSGQYVPPGKIEPLSGVYTEENYDERKIATVYLVSPPNAEGEPNGTWQPFVQHDLFWPLTYQAPPPFRPRELSSGALAVPLLGGIVQPIVNFFTAAIGDTADMALNWIQAQSNRGRWWTATGGGSDVEFPIEPPAVAKVTGLGRAQRIAATNAQITAQQFAEQRRQVLNPAFPYRAVPYTP